jgi:hypothetical protein
MDAGLIILLIIIIVFVAIVLIKSIKKKRWIYRRETDYNGQKNVSYYLEGIKNQFKSQEEAEDYARRL